MVFKILILIYLFVTVHIECKKYRYDYTYYPEIEGWLKLNKIPATWHEARLRCHLEGAELASPLDKAFLKTFKRKADVSVWTGVHSIFSKGDYFSVGGIPLLRMPISWAPGEPDNYCDKEQCIAMLTNGTFADVCCDELFPYFCFKKKTGSNVVNACGTVDDSYSYDARTGSCYKFHNYDRTWNQAFMTCASEGGHLAIVNTALETQVLIEIFSKYPANRIYGVTVYKDDAFVGFHDWGQHGIWTTIHGESLDALMDAGVTRWGSGQPLNLTLDGVGESCGCIRRDGGLNDGWCHARAAFICEKAPDSLQEDEDY